MRALLDACLAFDLDEVQRLVREVARDEAAFVSDNSGALGPDEPHTPAILAALSARGLVVQNEDQGLFELYWTLLEAGHPVPDGASRRCVARIVAGADPTRHERAVQLMDRCQAQNMLSWASSRWARKTIKRLERDKPASRLFLPTPNSNELFSDAVKCAAAAGNLPLLQGLCGHPPQGIEAPGSIFVGVALPTHRAAAAGHAHCVEYLWSLMPEDEWQRFRPSTSRYAPILHAASAGGQVAMVHWLLDHGMDINAVNEEGQDALAFGLQYKPNMEMLEAFLARGIHLDNGKGHNALHMVIWKEMDGRLEDLLAAGADANRKDDGLRTPLILAGQTGRASVIAPLLAAGADIDAQDVVGMTAIAYACRNDREEAFLALREAGARMDIADKKGVLPADMAKGAVKAWIEQAQIREQTPQAPSTTRSGARF